MTILVVDDNKGVRHCCREEFEDRGYRVLLARDGHEALRLLESEQPDLVILDVRMPRMSGLELIERIKGQWPWLHVILFTEYESDCIDDHRRKLAAAWVRKGADLTELRRVVGDVLASYQRASGRTV